MSPDRAARADTSFQRTAPLSRAAAFANPALLAGLYVYVVTALPSFAWGVRVVASPAAVPRAWLVCAAGLAPPLCLLGAAWATSTGRATAARALGAWGFLGSSAALWLLHAGAADLGRLDPWRGWFGAVGLALYSLAWGVPDAWRRERPEQHPRAELVGDLEPRERLSRGALLALAVAVASAAALFALSFRVGDAPRGVLGQALTSLAAVALISAAARHAARSRPWVPAAPSLRLARASRALLLVALLLAAALARLALGA